MPFKKKTLKAATLPRRQLDYGVTERHPDKLDLVANESISTAGADVLPISQDAFWKTMITPQDMKAVNSAAEDEQEFRTVSRHFWNRAFLFHRCWNAEDLQFIYDHVLQNITMRDRARLKVLLDEALLEVEEAYVATVRQFATYWLNDTPMGQQYMREYEDFRCVQLHKTWSPLLTSHRKKRKPLVAPKPELPATGPDLLTKSGKPYGFYWNKAVSTRFWRRSLVSVNTAKPTVSGAIAWLDEDVEIQNRGQGLWINALDGVALELVRRAITILVKGENRMSRDVHRFDFAAVLFPEAFRSKVCTLFSLQAVVKSKSYQVLRSTSPDGNVLIDRQHSRTTLPHLEEEADTGQTDTQEERRVLEPGPDYLQNMFVSIKEMVDVTGDEDAKATAEALRKSFDQGVMQIQNAPGTATTVPLGILEPQVSNTPYSNELGDIYGKANIFGRCNIHRAVLEVEILRLQESAQAMMQRAQLIKDEIAQHDINSAEAEKWWHVTQDAYNQYETLQKKSLEKKIQRCPSVRKRHLSDTVEMVGLGRPTKSAKIDSMVASRFPSTDPGSSTLSVGSKSEE